jgi:Flp pilus assembly protein TadB
MTWMIMFGAIAVLFCIFQWQRNHSTQQGNFGRVIDKKTQNQANKPQRSPNNFGKVIDYSTQNRGSKRQQWQNDSASEVKLERLVGHQVADRLIVNVLLNNPSRSRDWCADKALQDLMRDRQRG